MGGTFGDGSSRLLEECFIVPEEKVFSLEDGKTIVEITKRFTKEVDKAQEHGLNLTPYLDNLFLLMKKYQPIFEGFLRDVYSSTINEYSKAILACYMDKHGFEVPE